MVLRPPDFHPLPASDPSTFALTGHSVSKTIQRAHDTICRPSCFKPDWTRASQNYSGQFEHAIFQLGQQLDSPIAETELKRCSCASRRYGPCLHSESWVLSPPAVVSPPVPLPPCVRPHRSGSTDDPRRPPLGRAPSLSVNPPGNHGVLRESLSGLPKLPHATHQGTLSRLNQAKRHSHDIHQPHSQQFSHNLSISRLTSVHHSV